ncbi:hypothetical protein BDA99DRAFT_536690 [Phascolomyces articulosus]|uniref:Uncharacterized protein n=1 Tax=Phascolomyces articulosus TaxID=60185 RepID=A0AAD5PEZ7_9FUNG|nr:hypothetical protein BDA99DRAFT_536690 [Phascolomyces articulosus]
MVFFHEGYANNPNPINIYSFVSGIYVREIGRNEDFHRIDGTYRSINCLNEGLEYLTEIEDLNPILLHTVVKIAASLFVGKNLCENEDLLDIFKNFGTCVGSAR